MLNAGQLAFVTPAKAGGFDSARVQVRAKKLLQLCLKAFDAHATCPQLQQPGDRSGSNGVWTKLVDLTMKLTGDIPKPAALALPTQISKGTTGCECDSRVHLPSIASKALHCKGICSLREICLSMSMPTTVQSRVHLHN